MKRRTLFLLAVPMTLALGAAAFGFGVTGDRKPLAKPRPAADRRALADACASEATYAHLKKEVFDQAVGIGGVDPARLDLLAGFSVVRMVDPLVKTTDEELGVTVCTGRFVVEFPPGTEHGFGGLRRLTADIEYAAHKAADGSGLVYQLRGAEPVIYRLAAFDMKGGKLPTLTEGAVVQTAALVTARPPVVLEEKAPLPAPEPAPAVENLVKKETPAPVPAKKVVKQAKAEAKRAPEKNPVARTAKAEAKPKAKPATKTAAAKPKAKPVTKTAAAKSKAAPPKKAAAKQVVKTVQKGSPAKAKAKPVAKPVAVAKAAPAPKPKAAPKPVAVAKAKPLPKPTARPAVIKVAVTRAPSVCEVGALADRLICASPALATKQRRATSAYYSALDNADDETRAILRRTAGNFEAYRRGCRTVACLSSAFDDRLAEIGDIMADMR